jgi:hypothetical protein
VYFDDLAAWGQALAQALCAALLSSRLLVLWAVRGTHHVPADLAAVVGDALLQQL